MAKIIVAGLINIETTVAIDGFPIEYQPCRYPFFGVRSTVSGVGFNLMKALSSLGNEVVPLTLLGDDPPGRLARDEIQKLGLRMDGVLHPLSETAQSAILYTPDGKRAINVDLKDIQDRSYPVDAFQQSANGAELAVLCNINFSRNLLQEAKSKSIPIATDVHALGDLEDAYNRDYLAASDILFLSHENLGLRAEDAAVELHRRYAPQILVIGLGSEGALLKEGGRPSIHLPAKQTRPIVNTVGAGDALFSAFLHFWLKDHDARQALKRAILFASWKIGERGAAEGFLSEKALLDLAGSE